MANAEGSLSSHTTDLKGTLSIGLEEALGALDEALAGLSQDQFTAVPLPTEDSIAGIAMQMLQDLDKHAVVYQGGPASFPHDERWEQGAMATASGAESGQQDLARFRETIAQVRRSAERLLASADESDLRERRAAWKDWPGSAVSAYLAAIFHALSQVQRIWLLRGLLGALPPRYDVSTERMEREGTDSARAVAELNYDAVVKGSEPLWRITLIPAYQAQRRVPGAIPQQWWEQARRICGNDNIAYRFLSEDTRFRSDHARRLLFERTDQDGIPQGEPVAIHLVLTEGGWRVKTVSY